MSWRNTPERWGRVAMALHWVVALLLVLTCALGWRMQFLPNSPDKIQWYALHKSIGLTILALLAVRLAWRAMDATRPEVRATVPWMGRAAGAVHAGLYVVALGMAFSGWAYNSASRFPLRWFDLVGVPALVAPDPATKALMKSLHLWGFWLLVALVALHVGAALKHHYLDRDDTLRRMWPQRRRKEPVP